jgi:ABC-2 type transport system ATP-binding protein
LSVRQSYGQVQAVAGVDLVVRAGSIVAIVGPNGAGKTTTVECLEGLREPDAGTVRILGLDPVADRPRLVQRLGVQLQDGSLYEKTRVDEAFWVAEPFYERPLPADELLRTFGLEEKRRAFFEQLSGGQKQRLMTALAFVGDPEVAILDEPTSGLDPQARRDVWAALRERTRTAGKTVLLTTHNLDEAQDECDEVVIIDAGRVVAHGAPDELLALHDVEQRVAIEVASARTPMDPDELAAATAASQVERLRDHLVAYGSSPTFAHEAQRFAERHGVAPAGVELRRARLQDLFFILTGKRVADGSAAEVR